MQLIEPKVKPPLDEGFRPAVLASQNFRRMVQPVGVRAVIGLERDGDGFSRFETLVYPEVIRILNPIINMLNAL